MSHKPRLYAGSKSAFLSMVRPFRGPEVAPCQGIEECATSGATSGTRAFAGCENPPIPIAWNTGRAGLKRKTCSYF